MPMTNEQKQFMNHVVADMSDRIRLKFPKGVEKYDTDLHRDHPLSFLYEMAMDELTDLPTYMIALKYRLDMATKLLEGALELEDWEMANKALAILK